MTETPNESTVPSSELAEDYPDAGAQLQAEGDKAAAAATGGDTAEEVVGPDDAESD
jgi:hypothetical protein